MHDFITAEIALMVTFYTTLLFLNIVSAISNFMVLEGRWEGDGLKLSQLARGHQFISFSHSC